MAGEIPGARAQTGIHLHEVTGDAAVRVDGSLRDWRGIRFVEVGRGDDASMRFALGFDDEGLYVAAEVRDQRFVRTKRRGVREDAVVLTLALPAGRGYRGVDVWLYAGVPGRSRGSAAVGPVGGRPQSNGAVRVVEGPRPRGPGYVVEAHVPWRILPGRGEGWRRGRGAIRLRDVDQEAHPEVEAEPASAPVDRRALGRLPQLMPVGGSSDLVRRFLQAKQLGGTRPRFDLEGDVAGDRRPERVVLVDRYVLVLGPGYKAGSSYDFVALPVQNGGDVLEARLVDLTGNGKAELAVSLRQRNERGARDVWRVVFFDGRRVRPGFGVEVRKQTSEGSVQARLDVRRRRRGPPLIEVRAGRAHGLDAERFQEASAGDAQPILLPWGPIRARRYRWDGQRFAVVDEQPNPRYREPDPDPEPSAREESRARRRPARASAPSERQLFALARRERGIDRSTRPRFARSVDVVGDRQPERLVILDRALVAVGPGIQGGRGYFHFVVPVSSPSDVLGLETADLTGDGSHEVFLRVRQTLGELEGEPVHREVLLVHCFHEGSFPRIAAVEVAREHGRHSLRNRYRTVRRGKRAVLVVEPGRVRGWDASSWPFAAGDAGDGVTPPLLPWRDRPVRFGFRGGRLVPR